MKDMLRRLYEGDGTAGRVFRAAMFVFDVGTIAYFLFTATSELDARLIAIDIVIGAFVALDLTGRAMIAENRVRFAFSFLTLADLVVILSLALPLIADTNFAFLRVLRLLRLIRTMRAAQRLDEFLSLLPINTRVSVAAANLGVFIFVVTSLVWVFEHQSNPALHSYVDALYFTITTLTTTGFGDITLEGTWGRVLSILIMVFGVGLFLQLIQTLFRPGKVDHECPVCGLSLHERDAIHCKHCGETLHIETEGDT